MKEIKKNANNVKETIVNGICMYNVVCFIVFLYGKIAECYAVMDIMLIAICLPVVLYVAYKCFMVSFRIIQVLASALFGQAKRQIRGYQNNSQRAA